MATAAARAPSAALAAARFCPLVITGVKPKSSTGWSTLGLGSESIGGLIPASAELLVWACALGTAAGCGVGAVPVLRPVMLTLEPPPLLCRLERSSASPACGACGMRVAWRRGAFEATAAA